jgi:ribosomal-protein-alanine N-acetyltransferase
MNTFIASIDGEDVGVVRTVLDKDDRKVAWIISMWTLPSARGKSVGSKLLESVIDWANSSNIKSIKLDVVDSNDSAVRLYQRELTLY